MHCAQYIQQFPKWYFSSQSSIFENALIEQKEHVCTSVAWYPFALVWALLQHATLSQTQTQMVHCYECYYIARKFSCTHSTKANIDIILAVVAFLFYLYNLHYIISFNCIIFDYLNWFLIRNLHKVIYNWVLCCLIKLLWL